jgi:hypothetical protein
MVAATKRSGLGGIEGNTCWLLHVEFQFHYIFWAFWAVFPQTFRASRDEAVVCAGSRLSALRGLATCNGF